MSSFWVSVVARNPKDEARVTAPVEALVDTGSELTWLPAATLRAIGVEPRRTSVFATATGERVRREVGFVILQAEGFETIDEVVFGEAGDMTLLGVRTIEGFGVYVDSIGHRLVGRTFIVA